MQLDTSKFHLKVFNSLAVGILLLTDRAVASDTPFQSFTQPLNNQEQNQVFAQQPEPNQDRFLTPNPELPTPIPEEPTPELSEPPSTIEEPANIDSSLKIPIERIEIIGNTVLSPETLLPITQPLEGREISFEELVQAADAITQLYLEAGYITSLATLPEQDILNGVVQIQVIEGSLSDIQIEGLERLRARYIRSRLQRGISTPLNVNDLEEQLRLLRSDPLLENIRGRLQPGEMPGTSVLLVDVQEDSPWRIGLNVDNYAPPSLGSERLGVSLAYQNLSGWGDTLSANYDRSTTGGSSIWDLGYRLPVNAMDGTLSLRAVFDDNEVTRGPFAGEIDGEVERYEVSFRQPLVRTLREEFALSAGFSYRDGQTFLGEVPVGFGTGPDPDTGISRTSVFKFGQDYTRRDLQGAWALRSQFSIGTGLFDATNNGGDVPDSQFFSWLGQIQRVQRLSPDNLLIIQTDLQLTPDSLLSSEQFVIGGGQSLRGYRQNVRAGDNGFRFSIEDRITLIRDEEANYAVLQVAPFADMGAVWNNPDNPNDLNDQNFLAGAGLGLLLQPVSGFNIRLDYAFPIVEIDDKGNNAQDEGFYFSVNYQ